MDTKSLTKEQWPYPPEFEAWLRATYPGAFHGGRYGERDLLTAYELGRKNALGQRES